MSLRRLKLIEEGYGWMKDIGGLRKLHHRGEAKVTAVFTFTCAAYNLVRLRRLLAEPSAESGKSPETRLRSPPSGLARRRTRPLLVLCHSPRQPCASQAGFVLHPAEYY